VLTVSRYLTFVYGYLNHAPQHVFMMTGRYEQTRFCELHSSYETSVQDTLPATTNQNLCAIILEIHFIFLSLSLFAFLYAFFHPSYCFLHHDSTAVSG